MASSVGNIIKLSTYQRLRIEEDQTSERRVLQERAIKKARAWLKLRTRPKLRVPRSRILGRRQGLLSRFRVSWREAMRKLKNGHIYMKDLFGGNFLFMQYNNPTPFRCGNHKPYMASDLRHGMPSTTYSLRRIT